MAQVMHCQAAQVAYHSASVSNLTSTVRLVDMLALVGHEQKGWQHFALSAVHPFCIHKYNCCKTSLLCTKLHLHHLCDSYAKAFGGAGVLALTPN